MPGSRLPAVLAALCAALAVAGCGEKKLNAESVETQIRAEIEQKTRADVKAVACPEDRPVKQGDVFQLHRHPRQRLQGARAGHPGRRRGQPALAGRRLSAPVGATNRLPPPTSSAIGRIS
jgi:Domain of unknown function (DUF4333)